MNRFSDSLIRLAACSLGLASGCLDARAASLSHDWRDIRNGQRLPSETYCDQPYVVQTRDSAWLCVMTTGRGAEGQSGQHIVSSRSLDCGQTWSPLTDIEPASGPEASWAMPLVADSGRVYVFYTYNAGNLRSVIAGNEYARQRVDTLGRYAFKYSGDHGRSWSTQRYYLPLRTTAIDRRNPYGGQVHFFWGVGKPITDRHQVFLGAAKVGSFGQGFMESSEGILFRSGNILTEASAELVLWDMLPAGDQGLQSVRGPVCDEHNLVALRDGALYCVARTTEGSPVHYYSQDRGRTWSPPEYATYAPGGRLLLHPRANVRLWKTASGNYLLWFHNHAGRSYEDRNPAWLCGGHEEHGRLHWSQPEIALYDPDPKTRISYPDLVEHEGRFWITETQKSIARVHPLDETLLHGLWNQHREARPVSAGRVFSWQAAAAPAHSVALPPWPALAQGGGFSLDLWLLLTAAAPYQPLLDARTAATDGLAVSLVAGPAIQIQFGDGICQARWQTDPGSITPGKLHHLVITVDGGPKVITMVLDGQLQDGNGLRQFGWGRFPAALDRVPGPAQALIASGPPAGLRHLWIYQRPLRTSEAVANFHAGPPMPATSGSGK